MEFNKALKIQDLVDFSGKLVDSTMGELSRPLNHFVEVDGDIEGGFAFINHPKFIDGVNASKLACILAPSRLKDKIEALDSNKTWLFSPNVDLCARNIKQEFVFSTPYRSDRKGIHPTAVIDPSVEIGKNPSIGPFVVIEKNCQLGDNCYIGSHSVIEENVKIANEVTLHPHVYIAHSCEIGNSCEIQPQTIIGSEGFGYSHDHLGNHYRIPHTGKVILEDNVHIGAGTAIDRGTLRNSHIKSGTKVDNQCHFAHNSVVGKNGLITAQLVMAGSSTLGDNFICGGKTAITGHVNVTDNVNVAGLTAIANDVKKPGPYGGYPIVPLKQHLKVRASSVHLPEFRKQLNRLLRKVFPEDYQD